MLTTKRSIFRESAIKQYIQGRDKDVLPRFVAPPFFLFLWIIAGVCLIVCLLAWSIQVPRIIVGTGTIVENNQSSRALAIIFLASDQLHSIRPGQPVQLQLIGTSTYFNKQTITSIEPTLLSPEDARQRYHLDGTLSLIVTQPAVVVTVALDSRIQTSVYKGSILHATVQVGTQRMLALFPGIGNLIGE